MNSWNWLILILCIYVIVELLIEFVVPYSAETSYYINKIDLGISVIFLIDFFWFFNKSKNKLSYFKSNWIDLIASVPFAYALRGFKIFKIAKLLRLAKAVRAARSIRAIEEVKIFYNKNRAHGTLLFYSMALIMVIFYCSYGFYNFESPVNDQVGSFSDSLWWAFITVTSVGYGDIYPITSNGKIIAVILTLGGMGLFSVLTADILSIFVKQKQ